MSALSAFDDPVAVAPGIGAIFGSADAASVERIAVADEVEPVPAPAFAVVPATRAAGRSASRRRSATVVRDERLDLLRRRRQADQVEGHAADERPFVGRLRGRQSLRASASPG